MGNGNVSQKHIIKIQILFKDSPTESNIRVYMNIAKDQTILYKKILNAWERKSLY